MSDGSNPEMPGTDVREGESIPSCPWCGYHDRAVFVGSPEGRYLCSCGSLFDGTDEEWRRLARHRRRAIDIRNEGTR